MGNHCEKKQISFFKCSIPRSICNFCALWRVCIRRRWTIYSHWCTYDYEQSLRGNTLLLIPNDPNPFVSVVAEKPYIQPTIKEKLEASSLSHPFAEHGPRPLPGSLSHLSGPISPGYIPCQIQNLWTVASYDTWVNWTAALFNWEIQREHTTQEGIHLYFSRTYHETLVD